MSLWNRSDWVYQTVLPLPGAQTFDTLVFEGVKLGASIWVNGVKLGC